MMKQGSIENSLILRDNTQKYIAIDALYLNDIKNNLAEIDVKDFKKDIRNKIFPYCDIPFAVFECNCNSLDTVELKKIQYEEVVLGNDNYFASDTGLIIVIAENKLLSFLEDYDYDDLLNSNIDLIDNEYWERLLLKYSSKNLKLFDIPGGGGTLEVVV